MRVPGGIVELATTTGTSVAVDDFSPEREVPA
jgi:hypothetical protein